MGYTVNIITALLPHQKIAVEKLISTRIGALFMEMGTGKSLTTIELVNRRQDRTSNAIWFCPVSLKETVRQEILKHTDCQNKDIYVFNNKTKEKNIPKSLWYIVGIESMSASARVVFCVNTLINANSFVIVDESSYIKGAFSLRTTRITAISEKSRYRLILTGTPISQGIVDLYAQMKFLSPKILGYNSFYSFAHNHLEYSEKYPGLIVRAHNTEYIAAKIKPYVYQVTKECLDLPEKLYESRYFSMTFEQREYYDQIKNDFLSEIDQQEHVDSTLIFRLFTALQQVVCGFWNEIKYNKELKKKGKTVHEFEHYRVDILLDIIKSIPQDEKIIIWAKYEHDIKQISQALSENFGEDSFALFYGKINEEKRQIEKKDFQESKRFFIATQSCGGHGLNLTEAHYAIFYNNNFKYSERLQAEDREHRIGQRSDVTYIDIICSDSIDQKITKALYSKEGIVESFKREVNKVKNDTKKIKKLIQEL
ncbi:MAG: hypothetical protein A3K77_00870 [Euryarchaeota archaeon RBG_13_31_8]|nr:MAG: hypothetical protein A3K77_00870 [Euryarchaeota archaeon RBG_13_31_8]